MMGNVCSVSHGCCLATLRTPTGEGCTFRDSGRHGAGWARGLVSKSRLIPTTSDRTVGTCLTPDTLDPASILVHDKFHWTRITICINHVTGSAIDWVTKHVLEFKIVVCEVAAFLDENGVVVHCVAGKLRSNFDLIHKRMLWFMNIVIGKSRRMWRAL